MTKTKAIEKAVMGGMTVLLSLSLLAGCGTGDGTAQTEGTSQTDVTEVNKGDGKDTTADVKVTGDGSASDGTSGGKSADAEKDAKTDGKEDETGDKKTAVTAAIPEDTNISVYAVKVGFVQELSDGKHDFEATSADEWKGFLDKVSISTYDDQGNESKSLPDGMPTFDQAFFDEGNKVLVTYCDLGTGSANPKVAGWDQSPDGQIRVSWESGITSDEIVTDDMSGFVVIAEVPEGETATGILVGCDVSTIG